MRISTANAYDTSLQALMNRQSAMSATEQQMTTGKRVNLASDDPAAAARTERALAAENRNAASQRAVDASKDAMTLSESAMGDATGLLQSAREALVQAGNATYTDTDRAGVATTLAGLRSQLLAVANTVDSAGNHLFGGQGGTQQPFVDTTAGVQYRGTDGSQQSASTDALALATTGAPAWMQSRTGNGVFEASATAANLGTGWIDSGSVTDPSALTGSTYRIDFDVSGALTTYSVFEDGNPTAQSGVTFAPGAAVRIDGMSANISGSPAPGDSFTLAPSTSSLSVFDALDQAIAALKTPGRSSAQVAQGNARDLTRINTVLGSVIASRSAFGAEMNRTSDVTDRLTTQKLSVQTQRSNAQDLDMTQAISDFTNQQTGYDAALKAYTMVQKLSLFNYLSS